MKRGEWLGWAVLGLLGCTRERPQQTSDSPAATAATNAVASAVPSAAPRVGLKGGASGPCPEPRADSQAVSVASCPTPRAYIRNDGVGDEDDAGALRPVKPSVLPPWDLESSRAFACAYACVDSSATAHLLAWSVTQGKHRSRNHNALYAIERPDKPLTLVTMNQNPRKDWWNIEVSFHYPFRPIQELGVPPTRAELDRLLQVNMWRFEHDEDPDGRRVLAGNVLDDVWTAVLGLEPWRHYPKGIEQ